MSFPNKVNTGNKFDDYVQNWIYLLGLSQTNLGIKEILTEDEPPKDMPAWEVVFAGVRTNWSAMNNERTSQIGVDIKTYVEDVETQQQARELVKLTYRTFKLIVNNHAVNGFTGKIEIENVTPMAEPRGDYWIITGSEIQVWGDFIDNTITANTEPWIHPGTD